MMLLTKYDSRYITLLVLKALYVTFSQKQQQQQLLVLLQNKIGSGKLMGPKGVSVDRNGHVIVVDNKSCCVFIFQLNGKLVTKFGNRGNGDRQFAGTLNGNTCTAPYCLSPAGSHLHVE